MFARVVGCRSKAGRSDQVGNKLDNEVLPILQKQPGFVDFLTGFPTRQTPKGWCASVSGPRNKIPRDITASTMTRSPTC
jgi:hypothetical protein